MLALAVLAVFVVPVEALPVPRPVPSWFEAVVHVGAFAGLTVVWALLLPRVALWAVVTVALGVALLAEGSQALPFVERSAKLLELGFNVVGVVAGGGVAYAVRLRRLLYPGSTWYRPVDNRPERPHL